MSYRTHLTDKETEVQEYWKLDSREPALRSLEKNRSSFSLLPPLWFPIQGPALTSSISRAPGTVSAAGKRQSYMRQELQGSESQSTASLPLVFHLCLAVGNREFPREDRSIIYNGNFARRFLERILCSYKDRNTTFSGPGRWHVRW